MPQRDSGLRLGGCRIARGGRGPRSQPGARRGEDDEGEDATARPAGRSTPARRGRRPRRTSRRRPSRSPPRASPACRDEPAVRARPPRPGHRDDIALTMTGAAAAASQASKYPASPAPIGRREASREIGGCRRGIPGGMPGGPHSLAARPPTAVHSPRERVRGGCCAPAPALDAPRSALSRAHHHSSSPPPLDRSPVPLSELGGAPCPLVSPCPGAVQPVRGPSERSASISAGGCHSAPVSS